ncbi:MULTISPECIES: hypothetical protein [Mycobacteriaceae]|uniref:Uncharacterized protein n=1 Tax=Mycolicibacterium neoaurum VKM Ac-1815D TaxID=700508 RepID=V5XJQ6_MYCNE|nr:MULTISPECIES: hypothetical protein [Mycobacteriaceae]AXK75223.1 hypothetical protein DXK33_09000 [Mycolicibacterium neoaurum]
MIKLTGGRTSGEPDDVHQAARRHLEHRRGDDVVDIGHQTRRYLRSAVFGAFHDIADKRDGIAVPPVLGVAYRHRNVGQQRHLGKFVVGQQSVS